MPKNSVLKQSSIILGLSWLMMPLDFITGALVARAIGPEGKGVILLLGGLAAAIMSFANFGTPYGAIYYYKQGRYTLSQIVTASFMLVLAPAGLAIMAFFLVSDSFVNVFLGNIDQVTFPLAWLLLPLLGTLVHMLFAPVDAFLIREDEMKLYGIKNAGVSLSRILLILLLSLALGWGISGVIWSQFLGAMIGVVVPVYWLKKQGVFGSLRFSVKTTVDMLRIGLQRYAIMLVTMIAKRFDSFLIAGVLSVQEVGFFSIALGLLNLFKTIPSATMWPLISKLVGRDDNKLSQFSQVVRIQFILMLVLTVLFAPLVPLFIGLVYGGSFLPATRAVWLILPGVSCIPFITSGHAYFTSKGQPGRILIPFILSTVVQVGISLILVPKIGVCGSAIAISANNVCMSAMIIFMIAHDSGLRIHEIVFITRKDCHLIYSYITSRLTKRRKMM